MALPDPKSLDFAALDTGAFADYAAKGDIDTKTLDYASLLTGPFVGYPYEPEVTVQPEYCFGIILL